MQKVGYSYDYQAKKILDPLSLSATLKQFGVLSQESRDKLSKNLPDVGHKITLLAEVQKALHDQTVNKFQECFASRNKQGTVSCIQVFFNLEILSEQIQNRVNVTLRSLHMSLKKQISELQ
jgi:hypothetical protein